jgi:hypothetical protein
MAVCCLVTIFAVGALIYALTIFSRGFPASAGLRRSNSILVSLRFPGVSSIGVILAGMLSIVAHDVTV